MKKAIIDFSTAIGRVKPQHCISFASRAGRGFTDVLFQALGMNAYSRMRENALGYGKSVDIPYIFRNFDADENDPASYYFPQTDTVMADFSTFAEHRIFCLGGPRELHEPRIYCTVPKDIKKWASVCCNIIRHYNEGLWNGFCYDLSYFEVWNAPDDPIFWDGTPEQYYELYAETARQIKAMDPTRKVGGASFALNTERGFDFLEGFLSYVKAHDLPLDFLSYSAYETNLENVAYKIDRVKAMLSDYGKPVEVFQTAFGCVDEAGDERTRFDHLRDEMGMAYLSAVMTMMQKAGTDASMLFPLRSDGQYCAVYDWHGEWQKPVYALFAYKALYELGTEVRSDGYGLYPLAAKGEDGRGAILLTSFSAATERAELLIKGFGRCRAVYKAIDKTRDLSTVKEEVYSGSPIRAAVELRGYSAVLVELEPIAE